MSMGNLAACSKPFSNERIIAYVLLGWSSDAHACSSVVGGWCIEKLGRISLQLRLERLRLARNRTDDTTTRNALQYVPWRLELSLSSRKSYGHDGLGKLMIKWVPLPKQVWVRSCNLKICVTNVVARLMEISI